MSIPLTFDWSTLVWLKTRMTLWWQRRRLPVIRAALLGLLSVLSACVPVTRFEEAQSAAQVELEGRRRAEHQLQQIKAENGQLRAQLQQQGQVIDEREQALSQAELDGNVQGKQRQEAEGMVEQLRGELARVSGHLQSFGEDKQRLSAALEVEVARSQSLARATRDATLLWSDAIQTGEYTLDAEPSRVVLRVPRPDVLAPDDKIKQEAASLISNVARLMKLQPTLRLVIYDSAAPADALPLAPLVAALAAQGVAAERIVAGAEGVTPSAEPAQIALGFSVP